MRTELSSLKDTRVSEFLFIKRTFFNDSQISEWLGKIYSHKYKLYNFFLLIYYKDKN